MRENELAMIISLALKLSSKVRGNARQGQFSVHNEKGCGKKLSWQKPLGQTDEHYGAPIYVRDQRLELVIAWKI